jgi:hypothetical protein
MSVLIRGMTMPERCGVCPCARSVDSVDWYCWQCTATEKVLNKFDVQESRPQHCPLVEVKTPHGRLIDEKDLSDRVLKWLPPDPCGKEELEYPIEANICVSLMMEVEESETVIESED